MRGNDRSQEPLLSLRSAAVLRISLQAAAGTGILTYTGGNPTATAVLASRTASGAAVAFTRSAIG